MDDETTILIVEDDDVFAESLRDVLAEAGRKTTRAITIVEARRALAAHRISLVLLDLRLGNERGRHFLDDVAGLPDVPPVLVLSGDPKAALVAREFGVACLPKPFAMVELLVAIRTSIAHGLRPTVGRAAAASNDVLPRLDASLLVERTREK